MEAGSGDDARTLQLQCFEGREDGQAPQVSEQQYPQGQFWRPDQWLAPQPMPQPGWGAPGSRSSSQASGPTRRVMSTPSRPAGRPRRKHRVLKTIGILFLALILVAAVFKVTGVNDWIGYAYREYKRKAEKTGVREGLEKFVANHPNASIYRDQGQ